MNRSLLSIYVLCLTILISAPIEPVAAVEIGGIDIPDKIQLGKGEPELVLNGTSIRKAYIFADVYIGSLYLESKETNEEAIFNSDGYKRMSFYLLRDVRGRRIATALKDAMQLNLPTEDIEGFSTELGQLMSFLDRRMKKGEEGIVEYIPGEGSRIITANDVRGVIPGKAFFNAILSSWIGEEPVSSLMKRQLLGEKKKPKKSAVRSKHDDW